MTDRQTDFLATVGSVYGDGITLIFDGQTEPTKKRYKCNGSCSFSPGQRVKVVKISGTYIVEYPIASHGSASGGSGGGVGPEVTGNLSSLHTSNKSDLVAAINEIHDETDGKLNINQGTTNSGRLFYVDSSGKLVPLRLGAGLRITSGYLIADANVDGPTLMGEPDNSFIPADETKCLIGADGKYFTILETEGNE